MKTLRATGRKVDGEKDMLQSAEVRASRQISDVRHGFNKVAGSPGFQLSLVDYDDMLEGALSGRWTAVNVASTPTLGAVASSHTFTRGAGSFTADGFRVGDWIVTTGFSNAQNNGTFLVTAVGTTTITVLQTTLVDESNGTSKTLMIKGKRLSCGTTLLTYTFEQAFNDLAKYRVFKGVTVNTMDLNIQPAQMVGGTFGLIGMSFDPLASSPLDASPDAPSTNSPFSSFDGSLYEGGTLIAVVTGITLKLDNKRSVVPVVGSKYSPDVFEGSAVITGELTAFFQNATLLDKFVNETESNLWLRLNDLNGTDFMAINIPRLKYTGGMIDPPQEGPVPLTLPFQCLEDSVTGTSLMIQRSNT